MFFLLLEKNEKKGKNFLKRSSELLSFKFNLVFFLPILFDYPNNIKNATRSVNNAIDSVNAKPNNAYPTSCFVTLGLRAALLIKEPNTTPKPQPTPPNAIVAQPAPINFAASNIFMLHYT